MITRRNMLKTGAAAGALSFAASLPGVRAASHATLPLRRSLQGMDLDDQVLVTLREFVTMMKDPSRNGQNVSWVGFSDIHGSFQVGFNLCPHGNWYFLPWHRSYVRMYERAARALTGDMDFAMPYWDWTNDPGFPAAFGDATFDGQPNPLFVQARSMTTGDEMDVSVTGQGVMDVIFGSQTFEEFGSSRGSQAGQSQNSTDPMWIKVRGVSGELESNPHDNVHCDVRGPFMCSGASPQDPVFQMHHCNIDRIWAEWIDQGGANSNDPLWLNMPFVNNYFDPEGDPYTDVVNQLLEVEPLGYTYGIGAPEEEPYVDPGRVLYLAALYGSGGLEAAGFGRNVQPLEQVASPGDPLNVSLRTSGAVLDAALDTQAAGLEIRGRGSSLPTVYAFIRGLAPTSPDATMVRVFVNLPDAGAETETAGNAHYVSSIGFFGPIGMNATHGGAAGHDMRKNVAVDLTPALKALKAAGTEVGDDITVQMVPVAQQPGDDPGDVSVSEIELAIV